MTKTTTEPLTLQEQKEIRIKAISKIEEVCGNCELIIENRKKLGNKAAYNVCVRQCPVGKELQVLGRKLLTARGGIDQFIEEEEMDKEEQNI